MLQDDTVSKCTSYEKKLTENNDTVKAFLPSDVPLSIAYQESNENENVFQIESSHITDQNEIKSNFQNCVDKYQSKDIETHSDVQHIKDATTLKVKCIYDQNSENYFAQLLGENEFINNESINDVSNDSNAAEVNFLNTMVIQSITSDLQASTAENTKYLPTDQLPNNTTVFKPNVRKSNNHLNLSLPNDNTTKLNSHEKLSNNTSVDKFKNNDTFSNETNSVNKIEDHLQKGNIFEDISNTNTANDFNILGSIRKDREQENKFSWINNIILTHKISRKPNASLNYSISKSPFLSENTDITTSMQSLMNDIEPNISTEQIREQSLCSFDLPKTIELSKDFRCQQNTDSSSRILNISENLKMNPPVIVVEDIPRNILQKLTADAGICKCSNCVCNDTNNCQNCSTSMPNDSSKVEQNISLKSCDKRKICTLDRKDCCSKNSDCSSCCVIISIKSLPDLHKGIDKCTNISQCWMLQ